MSVIHDVRCFEKNAGRFLKIGKETWTAKKDFSALRGEKSTQKTKKQTCDAKRAGKPHKNPLSKRKRAIGARRMEIIAV